jgi:hypothetical protein
VRLDRNVHAHAAFVALLRTSLPNFLLTLLPLPFLPRTFFSRTLPLFLLTLLRLKRFLPRTSLPLFLFTLQRPSFLFQSVELEQHSQHSVCVHPPPCHTGCPEATTVAPSQPRSSESIPPPDRPASSGRVRRETRVTMVAPQDTYATPSVCTIPETLFKLYIKSETEQVVFRDAPINVTLATRAPLPRRHPDAFSYLTSSAFPAFT